MCFILEKKMTLEFLYLSVELRRCYSRNVTVGTERNSDSQDDSVRLRPGHIQRVSFHFGGNRRNLPQQIRTHRSA